MKIGTKLQLNVEQNSWALHNQTLLFVKEDDKWYYCTRKGGNCEVYPFSKNEMVKVSWNPINIIKRMFSRAFERPYK